MYCHALFSQFNCPVKYKKVSWHPRMVWIFKNISLYTDAHIYVYISICAVGVSKTSLSLFLKKIEFKKHRLDTRHNCGVGKL